MLIMRSRKKTIKRIFPFHLINSMKKSLILKPFLILLQFHISMKSLSLKFLLKSRKKESQSELMLLRLRMIRELSKFKVFLRT